MKLCQCLCLLSIVTTSAFTTPFGRRPISSNSRCLSASTETSSGESDFQSAMDSPSIYDKLGFSEDEVAIGVDADDVLEWLGTKDQLMTKFVKDNPQFDDERAAEEVCKFMLDAEMVNKYIVFERRKTDPVFLRQEAEKTLSDPSVWGTYAAWIIGGASFAIIKNLIVEPKFASGEWEEIHINIPNMFQQTADTASSL